MEKSIENIWKEGFLKSDALAAPKINKLYSQKSIHIIDHFKSMMKVNIFVILVIAFLIWGMVRCARDTNCWCIYIFTPNGGMLDKR